jgi:hypothetical protein
MNRPVRLFALIALATALSACSVGSPEEVPTPSVAPSASPTPSPTPSPSPTPGPTVTPAPSVTPSPATDPAVVLAANGIGPYVVGASLADLQSRGLITNVQPSFHCDDSWQGGYATGRYAERLWVTFYLGRLIDVHTSSTELVTPSGARVGMTLKELQAIYGDRGKLIRGYESQAFSVRVAGTKLGIVFYFEALDTHPIDPKVTAIAAGGYERLEDFARNGEGC